MSSALKCDCKVTSLSKNYLRVNNCYNNRIFLCRPMEHLLNCSFFSRIKSRKFNDILTLQSYIRVRFKKSFSFTSNSSLASQPVKFIPKISVIKYVLIVHHCVRWEMNFVCLSLEGRF